MESKLTDRDVVALHAMQGLLARPKDSGSDKGGDLVAAAFDYADQFLERSAADRNATGAVGTA